jgi:tetratricopeptide (TPR) repeat protein
MASYLKLYSDKQNAEKALFAQLDKDQDGKLAGDELEQLSAERRDRLSTADASGDGALDQTEFAATSDAFETDKILNVALYITETWPSQPEAAEALNTLIPFMIREGKLKEAQVYLQRIPLDSPARGEAELKTGQAMWGAYLRGMQDVRKWEQEGLVPEGVDPAAEKARLVEVKNNAEKTLADGVGRMQQAGTVDRTLATAVLSLAQIYVDTDQAAKAVQLLEDPKIGILKLVASNDPATSTPGLAEETYKTALRAYISHLAKAADPQQSDATIDKAKGVMEALKTTVGPTPEDQRKLVAIYYSLALDLKQQLKLVESPEAKDALSKGFETFLKQVGSGAAELNIIYWVAETFANMGEEFQGPGGILTPDAKRYYEQAVATYQSILDQAQALKLDAQMQTQVRMRQAMMWRQLGEFEKSINAFATVLRENNMLLNVQIEAARTYQEWAGKGVPGHYDDAMKGAMPDAQTKKNVIWGWGRLAQITAGAMSRSRDNPEAREGYRSTFHESRYNLALCRLLLARSQTNTAERRKYMDYAKRDITMTHSLYPDLGGPDWMAKYNDLLKRIQTELAEPAVGLTMPATTGQNR